ncbi:hypothetical protein MED297_18343 [Reinekea sp. MED297]|uniref:Xanthine/uracil/vitamin C permease n=2 Tax=Reinekea TaxID=230494 RepID=A4BEU0_9GAMM|nr:hypothetical protein MED297_18343 [Reinekea sp. MED297] [Reinekea blandensis MED297]
MTNVMNSPNVLDDGPSDYQKARIPASEFETRDDYLDHELKIFSPRRWKLNLPGRDFSFEWEDLVPALAGTIGITVMFSAVISAYAAGFGLDQAFVIENVRLELMVSATLFVILVSGFLNPRANLAGNHGPMIPLIGMIAASGGHPLALGIMIGIFGMALSLSKGGSKLVNLTSHGVSGGLLIYLGAIGVLSQLGQFKDWAIANGVGPVFIVVLMVTTVVYAYLAKIRKRWMAIPVCSGLALVISLAMGAPFEFVTSPGLPSFNPMYWWGETTGWKLGLPDLSHFIAVTPFAILAVGMWSPDFLGHRVFQELNYPKEAKNALMDVDDTMTSVSLRQATASIIGGGNVSSSWGTFMIPSAIAKRPIPGGAILTGVFCILLAVTGYPMDLTVWRPIMCIALLVGVFMPLLEAGIQMVKDNQGAETAGICILGSAVVNPVFGWALTMLLDNNGLIGNAERKNTLGIADRIIIPGAAFTLCTISMLLVGMIPGIPALL